MLDVLLYSPNCHLFMVLANILFTLLSFIGEQHNKFQILRDKNHHQIVFGVGILSVGGTLACYDFLGEKVIIIISIFVFAIICLQWLYFRCIKTIAMFFMSDDDCNYNNQMNWTWISMIYPCLMTSFYIVIGQSPLSTILNPSYALYDWNDLSQFSLVSKYLKGNPVNHLCKIFQQEVMI